MTNQGPRFGPEDADTVKGKTASPGDLIVLMFARLYPGAGGQPTPKIDFEVQQVTAVDGDGVAIAARRLDYSDARLIHFQFAARSRWVVPASTVDVAGVAAEVLSRVGPTGGVLPYESLDEVRDLFGRHGAVSH